jgi:hypothetical protein
MTTPALAPAAPATSAKTPTDADMIEAMFRGFARVIPGIAQGHPDNGAAEVLSLMEHYGAASTDLGVIRAWLAAR